LTTQDEKEGLGFIAIAMLMPFVLSVPPVIGWFFGRWLDGKLGTDPYFMYIFIILGIAAGIREFIRLLKKFSANI